MYHNNGSILYTAGKSTLILVKIFVLRNNVFKLTWIPTFVGMTQIKYKVYTYFLFL